MQIRKNRWLRQQKPRQLPIVKVNFSGCASGKSFDIWLEGIMKANGKCHFSPSKWLTLFSEFPSLSFNKLANTPHPIINYTNIEPTYVFKALDIIFYFDSNIVASGNQFFDLSELLKFE